MVPCATQKRPTKRTPDKCGHLPTLSGKRPQTVDSVSGSFVCQTESSPARMQVLHAVCHLTKQIRLQSHDLFSHFDQICLCAHASISGPVTFGPRCFIWLEYNTGVCHSVYPDRNDPCRQVLFAINPARFAHPGGAVLLLSGFLHHSGWGGWRWTKLSCSSRRIAPVFRHAEHAPALGTCFDCISITIFFHDVGTGNTDRVGWAKVRSSRR